MVKKLLKTIAVAAVTAALAVSAVACGGAWKSNVTLTSPGAPVRNGGFVAETENYVYFINGEETYTENNKLGTPVKGSLMVAEKSKLADGGAEAQTVVPKLFAAGDLTAGVYIYGDKVYYATPSVKKNTSGAAATDYLDVCSSTLDGKTHTTYTTVKGNATNYRFVQVGESVHFVYYNSEDTELIDYNVSSKTEKVIEDEVSAVKFVANEALSGAAVLYTVVPKNESTNQSETYNVLYGYMPSNDDASNKGTEIASGKGKENAEVGQRGPDSTYAVTLATGEYVFFTKTTTLDSEKVETYGAKVSDLMSSKTENAVKYEDNTDKIADTTLFTDLRTAYAVDGDYVVKYSDGEDGKALKNKETVAKVGVSKLLFLNGNDLYYISSSSELAKVDVSDAEAEQIRVSEGAVVTDWFAPVAAGGYVFYLDAQTDGLSYVNYAALDGTVVAEDTDDDEEDDLWYIKNTYFLGEMKDADKVTVVSSKISALSTDVTQITYDAEEKKFEQEEQIAEARAAYNGLSDKLKKEISKDELKILEKYENYLDVSKELNELLVYGGPTGVDHVAVTAENKDELQAIIDSVNARMEELEYTSADKGNLLKNGMWALQEVQKAIDELNEA